MRGMVRKFKKGIASFYIVAFSTLIMVIIAASFATVVISEIARTSNDDLSQSAYDAALAGVEDAKLAYTNYQSCLKKGVTKAVDNIEHDGVVTCEEILYWMQNPNCDMVAHILNRYASNVGGEVMISETTGSGSKNNLNQAYTCVKIHTNLADYRASLSSSTPYKVVKVQLKDESLVSDIKKVRLSWYSNREGRIYNYNNFPDGAVSVIFPPLGLKKAATPPTLAVEMIQTAPDFAMSELNGPANGNETDRATLYLVPCNNSQNAGTTTLLGSNTYIGAYSSGSKINKITAAQVASTNNLKKNLPYVVYCPENGSDEFTCSVEIDLPSPIDQNDSGTNGKRNADTFIFVVSLPYEQPDVDFAMEFCTNDGACSVASVDETNLNNGQNNGLVTLNNMQAAIDSTGRANNLFRRWKRE